MRKETPFFFLFLVGVFACLLIDFVNEWNVIEMRNEFVRVT